jgi:nucleotide-binding universal stress UspA family protein
LIQALGKFDRIMVAVADGAASIAAVGAAGDLAARTGAEVLALHVWCRDAPCCGPAAADCGLREDDDSLERALSHLRAAGVRCRGERWRTMDDRLVDALLAAADEYDASLVIVGGGRRRGPWAVLRPGLGLRLARRCARPVLLVPQPTATFTP